MSQLVESDGKASGVTMVPRSVGTVVGVAWGVLLAAIAVVLGEPEFAVWVVAFALLCLAVGVLGSRSWGFGGVVLASSVLWLVAVTAFTAYFWCLMDALGGVVRGVLRVTEADTELLWPRCLEMALFPYGWMGLPLALLSGLAGGVMGRMSPEGGADASQLRRPTG